METFLSALKAFALNIFAISPITVETNDSLWFNSQTKLCFNPFTFTHSVVGRHDILEQTAHDNYKALCFVCYTLVGLISMKRTNYKSGGKCNYFEKEEKEIRSKKKSSGIRDCLLALIKHLEPVKRKT